MKLDMELAKAEKVGLSSESECQHWSINVNLYIIQQGRRHQCESVIQQGRRHQCESVIQQGRRHQCESVIQQGRRHQCESVIVYYPMYTVQTIPA